MHGLVQDRTDGVVSTDQDFWHVLRGPCSGGTVRGDCLFEGFLLRVLMKCLGVGSVRQPHRLAHDFEGEPCRP